MGPPSVGGRHAEDSHQHAETAPGKPAPLLSVAAESGLSPEGRSNCMKNSQGLRARPSAELRVPVFLHGSPLARLPCALWGGPPLSNQRMGCRAGCDAQVGQM